MLRLVKEDNEQLEGTLVKIIEAQYDRIDEETKSKFVQYLQSWGRR